MILLLALGLAGVDARVQEVVERAGLDAAVVMDVEGRVLARAGKVEQPLPPGSTFKIVDVIAAAGSDALGAHVRCAGRNRVGAHEVRCYAKHGELTLDDAIPVSCNVWFGALGERLGTRALIDGARALGVGVAPGVLPREDAAAPAVADGVGVAVTALQLAGLVRQVATGRRLDGAPLAPPEVLARLRRGMRAAVERGTAVRAASSLPVAGKTGSAPHGASSVGWFAGYAPADAPSVIVVLMRRGVMGREVAGSAPPIFEAFFHGRAGR